LGNGLCGLVAFGDSPELVEHDARGDSPNPDPRADKLPAQAVREGLDRVLGGGVDRLPIDGLVPGDRARQDDVAGPCPKQVWKRHVDDRHRTVDVDVDKAADLVEVCVDEVSTDVLARVGHQDVDAAPTVQGLAHYV